MHISNKLKAVVAAVGTVVTALTGVFADNVVDASETGTLVTVLVESVITVIAVYGVRNRETDTGEHTAL